jgi:hypothetical protein
MPNIDLADLDHGIFPTSLRWNAELGILGYSKFDENTGERTIEVIELGSQEAKFVMDYATRERGYGMVRKGLYDMRLSPVGSPPPEWPGNDDFKPAIGFWLWNPILGELRVETNAAIFRSAISAVWDHVRTFREATGGEQPVVHFTSRVECPIAAVDRVFWKPVVPIIGWVNRDKVPCFAARQPTVAPPAAIDLQVSHALLTHLQKKPELQTIPEPSPQTAPARTRGRSKSASAPPATSKENRVERLLAAATRTPNHPGWSVTELYNAAGLYIADITDLVKRGRLEERGERFFVSARKPTPFEELLDDEIPEL